MRLLLATFIAALLLIPTALSFAKTSHAGWPKINGMLLINRHDGNRPLDARAHRDPFNGTDSSYSCDAEHKQGKCHRFIVKCKGQIGCPQSGRWVKNSKVHNELLGGHGNDTIHGGDYGDVIWGDYKPSGQNTTQRDHLIGGAGRDFIYSSHGHNIIHAGGGADFVKAHFATGHVYIDCGSGKDILYISHKVQKHSTIKNCETVSHKSLGY